MKKLVAVADWAADTLLCQEFRTAVEGHLQNQDIHPRISFVASSSSTIHTAFLASQVIQTEEKLGHPVEQVVFVNSDSRLSADSEDTTARPGQFFIIRLQSGMYVCGPNAGYTFSLIRHKIDRIFTYSGIDESIRQHRFRDAYPRVLALVMENLEDEMETDEAHTHMVPALDHKIIGHIDTFGNIITTIPHEELKGKSEFGELVHVTVHGITKMATYVEHRFAGKPGHLVVYPGSYGDPGNAYLEVSVWQSKAEELGETGIHSFPDVRPGMKIEIQ